MFSGPRTSGSTKHNGGCSYVFCQLLGELTCRDSGWLSWARFALPVASGVLSRVARFRLRGLVPGRGRRFFEHAVDHVASAAREADDGGVVVLALFAFALVVGDGRRVFGGRDERGLPQRVLEAFVAPPGGSLAP